MDRAKFQPRCIAVPIAGGMPHLDAEAACRFLLNLFPEVPILPYLPRSGYMLLENFPCLVDDKAARRVFLDSSRIEAEVPNFYERYLAQDMDYFSISPRAARGPHAMLEMLRSHPSPSWKLILIFVQGPVTFGMEVTDEGQRPSFYHETLRDVITKTLAMKAKWLEKKVREIAPGVPVLAIWGEAFLGMYGSAFASLPKADVLASINECLTASGDITGIHCCANTDWPLIMETQTDIIHFDAYEYAEALALYPQELRAFLERGGMLAWGIVPTSNEKIAREDAVSLSERLERAMSLMISRGVPEELLYDTSFICLSCTAVQMSIENAERAYHLAKQVSDIVRSRHYPS